jgi:hypothetical protein
MALNNSQVNGFKGYVGFGLREMNSKEYGMYCNNTNTSVVRKPLVYSWVNFTQGLSIRLFSLGCYYYTNGSWSSAGVVADVILSNVSVTVCNRYKQSELKKYFKQFILIYLVLAII